MGLKVTVAAGGNPSVWLYGVIGDDYGGVTADEFRMALQEIPSKQDIDVHIHSEGGVYVDAIAMHSVLKSRAGKRNVFIDGLAASGGSVVAMAGTSIEMAEGAWMMIHEAHGAASGRAADFREAADRLDATNQQLVSIYKARWKGTEPELRKALADETWLRSDSAVISGLADKTVSSPAIAACIDREKFAYNRVPEELGPAAVERAIKSYEDRLAAILD